MKTTTKIILIFIALTLLFVITWAGKSCQIEQQPELPSPVIIVLPTVNAIPTAIEPSVIPEIQDRQADTQRDIEETQSNIFDIEAEIERRGLKQ